ncbi:3 beta-hydroxysteroid dehydrogenase type 7-like [Hypanus sabinus]|uniref:3 beta-hydroxysteroid dehydrogenase type 7-like n=1 Tax=Hypanus sabinus TaxID=79690 RepID=UPI0028C48A5F|nr:3 beta-hydroxysteroid dehydrogenase type 7-like [Hypanus sabinus]
MPRERGLVCLVTGGCGFLGKHLVRLLAECGKELREIRVLDLVLDRELETLSTASLRVSLMQGDITSRGVMAHAVEGADLVFHLASVIDFLGLIPESQILSVNVQGTQSVIDACVQHNVPTLVYTSSMEAVGPNSKWQPFHRGNEDTVYEFAPASVYAKSKSQAEELIRRANGMKTASGKTLFTLALRPLGSYGEGFPLLCNLVERASRCRGHLFRFSSADACLGRVYAGNVAWMHLLAARALREKPGLVGGQVYYCYDDSPDKSFLDFYMEFLAPCGVKLVGRLRPVLPFFLVFLLALLVELVSFALRPFCTFAPVLNRYTLLMSCSTFTVRTSKAARHFGYRPLYTWEQSRARTTRWLQSLARPGSP